MKKFLVVFAFLLSVFALSAWADEWTGYISDSGCGAKKAKAAASEGHATCAQNCIKKGAAAVLVTEDGKLYKLEDQSKVVDHAGHKVTISGKLEGDTIKIEDIKM